MEPESDYGVGLLKDRLLTADQSRALDDWIKAEHGITGTILMMRAARAVFDEIRNHWPQCRELIVYGGTGNNGADGWLVAWLARQAGWSVQCYLVGRSDRIKGDALKAYHQAVNDEVEVLTLKSAALFEPQTKNAVIVDAVLGTGFNRELSKDQITAIKQINDSRCPVVAIDVPSGLDATTGYVEEVAVIADLTVTMIAHKTGLYTGSGLDHTGEIKLAPLDTHWDQSLLASDATQMPNSDLLMELVTRRRRTDHKGTFGHVVVVGGNTGMSGAGILAAEAALRTGSGLVSLVCHPATTLPAVARRPEIMAHGVLEASDCLPLLSKASAIVLGPGLGMDDWGRALFEQVMSFLAEHPTVSAIIDADALNFIAENPKPIGGEVVITPHPGEAARLLGCTVKDIEKNRFAAAEQLARRYDTVAVLKGAGSVITHVWFDEVTHRVSPSGNAGMATAGMGDVLSGVVGSLMGQGSSPFLSAKLGVQLHAEAGDLMARELGYAPLLASDVITGVGRRLKALGG